MRYCWQGMRLGLVAIAVLALPASVRGQDFQEWLDPELGKLRPRADYRFTQYLDARIEGQPTDFGLIEHSFSVSAVPVYQNARNEVAVSGEVEFQDIDTRARLDDTGKRLPTELWDVAFGGSYRHKFDNGWIGALGLTITSPSDEPFASEDEILPRAVGMLRVPHKERNAIILSLFYLRYEEFLGGVPVPGLAYQYVPSDRFNAVVGVPFTSVEYKPLEKLTLEAQYFPVREVRTRATYELFRPLRLFAGFDADNYSYFLADRLFKRERLFYYELRGMAGARFDLRHVGFQVRGGYAFNRFYFEGDEYQDRRDNRLDVDPSPFVAAGVAVRF